MVYYAIQKGKTGKGVTTFMGQRGLLEELTERTGCLYLSDLHLEKNHDAVKKAVSQIGKGTDPAQEWKDAFEYITGRRAAGTEEEIRRLF